jgi:hypothetical protein
MDSHRDVPFNNTHPILAWTALALLVVATFVLPFAAMIVAGMLTEGGPFGLSFIVPLLAFFVSGYPINLALSNIPYRLGFRSTPSTRSPAHVTDPTPW